VVGYWLGYRLRKERDMSRNQKVSIVWPNGRSEELTVPVEPLIPKDKPAGKQLEEVVDKIKHLRKLMGKQS
jgi:hypothetical protein